MTYKVGDKIRLLRIDADTDAHIAKSLTINKIYTIKKITTMWNNTALELWIDDSGRPSDVYLMESEVEVVVDSPLKAMQRRIADAI